MLPPGAWENARALPGVSGFSADVRRRAEVPGVDKRVSARAQRARSKKTITKSPRCLVLPTLWLGARALPLSRMRRSPFFGEVGEAALSKPEDRAPPWPRPTLTPQKAKRRRATSLNGTAPRRSSPENHVQACKFFGSTAHRSETNGFCAQVRGAWWSMASTTRRSTTRQVCLRLGRCGRGPSSLWWTPSRRRTRCYWGRSPRTTLWSTGATS